ncbi:MAG: hypothetical protein KF878_06555 [Planctomycetes bacterium]|nr:hypothetical protein [Planctomycetota bacterium]
MSDAAPAITLDVARHALARALVGPLVAGPIAAALLAGDASEAAAASACVGAGLSLAAALTAFAEALGARASPGTVAALAGLVGAGLGGALGLQLVLVDAWLRAGGLLPPGAAAAFAVVAGAVVFNAAVGVVVHHRLTLDPADRLAGTQGFVKRALARAALIALPLGLAPIAGLVAAALLLGCWLDARVGRSLARGATRDAARALGARLDSGDLVRERLELAAYAGHPAAGEVVATPFVPPDLGAWAEGLRLFGVGACARAAVAAVAVVAGARARCPGDARARARGLDRAGGLG